MKTITLALTEKQLKTIIEALTLVLKDNEIHPTAKLVIEHDIIRYTLALQFLTTGQI